MFLALTPWYTCKLRSVRLGWKGSPGPHAVFRVIKLGFKSHHLGFWEVLLTGTVRREHYKIYYLFPLGVWRWVPLAECPYSSAIEIVPYHHEIHGISRLLFCTRLYISSVLLYEGVCIFLPSSKIKVHPSFFFSLRMTSWTCYYFSADRIRSSSIR